MAVGLVARFQYCEIGMYFSLTEAMEGVLALLTRLIDPIDANESSLTFDLPLTHVTNDHAPALRRSTCLLALRASEVISVLGKLENIQV